MTNSSNTKDTQGRTSQDQVAPTALPYQADNSIPELEVRSETGGVHYYYNVKPEDCTIRIGGTSGDSKWIIKVRGNEHTIGYARRDFMPNETQKREIDRIDSELIRLRSLLSGSDLASSNRNPSTARKSATKTNPQEMGGKDNE